MRFSLRNVNQCYTKSSHPPPLWSTLLAGFFLTLSSIAQADIGATHTSLVSEFASFNTPGTVDGRVEAIAIDGDTVFVGGTFTQIREPLDGEILDQPYLFAYSKSTGNIIREFDPVLNNEVYALETTGDGSGVFAGGLFNIINGESNRRGLVKIDDNGDRVAGFGARADATVTTLVRLGNTLYVGGNFENISNTPVEHLAALDTTSGAVDPNLNLNFGGRLFTTRTPNAVQGVDDIDITSDGSLMVVIGNFSTIDNSSRHRLAVIELDGQAEVSDWNSDVYDVQCPTLRLPQYIRGVDIAPDDTYFVVGSQGFRRPGEPACDTIVRMDFGDLTDTDVQPTWVNYTGGDSVYEVVSTEHAIYVGGHFRWLTNDTTTTGRDAGPGSQERRGLGALDPLNGLTLLNWRSDRNPRGVGVFALIAEPEGLYMGDDTDFLNGSEHQKLKFLPIGSDTIDRPDPPSLPTTIISASGNNDVVGNTFNGSSFGNTMALNNSGFEDIRGAMFIGGQLFHADVGDNFWMSEFNGTNFEPRQSVDLFGIRDSEWDIDQITGMFFDYEFSRIYYTRNNQSRLFFRAFTPAGPYVDNEEFVAAEQSDIVWSDVSGMDVIDGYLYFARNNGTLFRAEIDGTAVRRGTTEAISGPGIDGRRWDNRALAFLGEGTLVPGGAAVADIEFVSSGSQTNGRFRTFEFPVTAGDTTLLRLEWPEPSAEVRLFVRDPNDVLVASDPTDSGSPKFLTVPAGIGGTYTASVLVAEGATNYTLQVNPVAGQPPAPPPPPPPPPPPQLADFEFSGSGDQTQGRFQVFNFDVAAGELIDVEVIWNDPNDDLRVFLRDETGAQIDRDTDGQGSPATVSAVAETSGEYSVAVLIGSGSASYDVLIDTTVNIVDPPQADFAFNSSGNQTQGRFQVFDFDVNAGDLIDVQVIWPENNDDVRVFLRDESDGSVTQLARDTDGSGSPATMSAVAVNSGLHSVAVLINNGAISYDVLVDISTPASDFEFSSSGSNTSGRFQTFDFTANADETIDVEVIWSPANAEVRVFLRDETNGSITQIDRDTDGSGSPATMSAVAAATGLHSVAVLVDEGTVVNYEVLVNTN